MDINVSADNSDHDGGNLGQGSSTWVWWEKMREDGEGLGVSYVGG